MTLTTSGMSPSNCPYKGLMPYDKEDEYYFVGRESETEIIAANLRGSRLTLLYGESGVGKSSILRAGVLPRMAELLKPRRSPGQSPHTPIAVLVYFRDWFSDPVQGLLAAVAKAVRASAPHLAGAEVEPRMSLVESLDVWTKHLALEGLRKRGTVLLIFDQFEEYFLYRADQSTARNFSSEFLDVLTHDNLPINVLVSIREDSLAKLDQFKRHVPSLFENMLRVDYLQEAAAAYAIEEPLRRFRERTEAKGLPITIEPRLVKRILEEVKVGKINAWSSGKAHTKVEEASEQAIETTCLQMVLTRLWQAEIEASSSELRLDTFETLGGAKNIVRKHFQDVVEALSSDDREVAERFLGYLVTPKGGKIAQDIDSLAKWSSQQIPRVQDVVIQLCQSNRRILRPVSTADGAGRYEIYHDVLGNAISDYVKHAESVREERRKREEELAELERRQQELERRQLEEKRELERKNEEEKREVERRQQELERRRLEEKRELELRNQEEKRELERHQEIIREHLERRNLEIKLHHQQRERKLLISGIAAALLLFVAASGMGVVAWREGQVAEKRSTELTKQTAELLQVSKVSELRRIAAEDAAALAKVEEARAVVSLATADSRKLASAAVAAVDQNRLGMALLLAAQACDLHPTLEARNSLFKALAASPHLHRSLRAPAMRAVRFADPDTIEGLDNSSQLWSIPVSAGNAKVAAKATWQAAFDEWLQSTGRIRYSQQHRLSIDFGIVAILSTFRQTRAPDPELPPAVFVADVKSGQHHVVQLQEFDTVNAFALSADGSRWVVGGKFRNNKDQTSLVCVDSLRPQNRRTTNVQLIDDLRSIDVNYDGSLVAVISEGIVASFEVWDTIKNAMVGKIDPVLLPRPTWAFEFSPYGEKEIIAIVGGRDSLELVLFNCRSGEEWASIHIDERRRTPAQDPSFPFAANQDTMLRFSQDGKQLAIVFENRSLRVLDVAERSLRQIGQPIALAGAVVDLAFSPSGQQLASLAVDDELLVWNVAPQRGNLTDPRATTASIVNRGVFALAASSGRIFSSTSNRLLEWDIQERRLIRTFESEQVIADISVTPDGRTLAAVGPSAKDKMGSRNESILTIWDRTKEGEPCRIERLPAPAGIVMRPDGGAVAFQSDGKVAFVDVTQCMASELRELANDDTFELAFSADSKWLATSHFTNVSVTRIAAGQLAEMNVLVPDKSGPLAFSPFGSTLAISTSGWGPLGSKQFQSAASGSAESQDTVLLWDVEAQRQIAALSTGGIAELRVLAFGNQGKLVAAQGAKALMIWDLPADFDPHPPLLQLTLNEPISNIATTPDSSHIAWISASGEPHLWHIDIDEMKATAKAIANRVLTKEEWNQFVGDHRPYPYEASSTTPPR